MAIFEIKSDLPLETRQEIDRVQAIDSGLRTTKEAALLTSLTPYLTNEIIKLNADEEIVQAQGETVPTGYSNFAVGAIFIKSDEIGRAHV